MMKHPIPAAPVVASALMLLAGCVTRTYEPGAADSPFHQLRLGQSYGDMVRVLGEPDESRSDDRLGAETALLYVPVWGLVESAADANPSSTQLYTYHRWGSVTIANNKIVRIEANQGT